MNPMKNNPSYAKGGKLTEKEARLLRALMGKLVGEEGMRVMQTSGKTPTAHSAEPPISPTIEFNWVPLGNSASS